LIDHVFCLNVISFFGRQLLAANGTAVEVVCVTGAASRVLVPFLSSETVPVASQYGAIFAITVREGFITIAVQVVC
jgi:hypothetical protein